MNKQDEIDKLEHEIQGWQKAIDSAVYWGEKGVVDGVRVADTVHTFKMNINDCREKIRELAGGTE